MRLANRFKIGLDVAQIGNAAFKIVESLFSVGLDFGLVGLGINTL